MRRMMANDSDYSDVDNCDGISNGDATQTRRRLHSKNKKAFALVSLALPY